MSACWPATSIAASERAAEEDRNAVAAIRIQLREAALHLVVLAVVVERLLAGPFGANESRNSLGAGVALVLVVDVSPSCASSCVTAGDDIQRDAAAGEVVERRELPREQRRRGEARPLRDEHVQPLRHAEHVLADLQAIRQGRVKRQQRAVEAGVLVRLGQRLDIGDDRAADPLRGVVSEGCCR